MHLEWNGDAALLIIYLQDKWYCVFNDKNVEVAKIFRWQVRENPSTYLWLKFLIKPVILRKVLLQYKEDLTNC